MDELEISGKRYISTRRAGREHKYHSDYIGQLIRGGKVQGQKVGRSWYVDESSLTAYLGKEPVKNEREAVAVAAVTEEAVPPVEVEKHERVTPWKKIPEVQISEPMMAVTIEEKEKKEEVLEPVEVEEQTENEEVEEKKEEESANFISIRKAPVENTKKNITYVAESTPVFPVKVRKQKISEAVLEVPSEEDRVEEKDETSVVDGAEKKMLQPVQYGLVAMLGVFAFIVVGGMSYLLSYEATVEGDQMSASITLRK